MKSFGLNENEISLEGILEILKSNKLPVDKLFPCLDFLRVEVLNFKGEIEKVLMAVPFDLLLEKGTSVGASKEAVAGVTMTLRLLCNASSFTDINLVKEDLIVKVIGKCTGQEIEFNKIITWIPLLIGLLYNVSSYLDSLKSLNLLHGILYKLNTKSSEFEVKGDEGKRIYQIIKTAVQFAGEEIKVKCVDVGNQIENCNIADKSVKSDILELLLFK